jgi:RNA recognition motif-containing protein
MYIYVGNLDQETIGAELRREFEAFGKVTKAAIITDRKTSASVGFGFVEMADQAGTESALRGMVGKKVHGRLLEIKRTQRVVDQRTG